MARRNAELPRLDSCLDIWRRRKRKHVVLDLLLAYRRLESSGSVKRSRVRPAECPSIRIFVDMGPGWCFNFTNCWFEESSWCLNSVAWLFLKDSVHIWAVVGATRRGLVTTVTDGRDCFMGEKRRWIACLTSRRCDSTTRSYISSLVTFTWWRVSVRIDLAWNWVGRTISKFILFVVARVCRIHNCEILSISKLLDISCTNEASEKSIDCFNLLLMALCYSLAGLMVSTSFLWNTVIVLNFFRSLKWEALLLLLSKWSLM